MQWELAERLAESLPKVQKFAGSSPKRLEACQEFAGSSPKVTYVFARSSSKAIGSLSGVRWELSKGDRELAKMASGVHRKKTKRLTRRSSEVVEKLAES
ncbi:hypothetical protein BHE74_00049710 [Ensete ventricosum]|nr:hypothetical protein BHE74_00049710 [Ensete ventricosum]